MELSISGNALKKFVRSIICLAEVGDELIVHTCTKQLVLQTLNASSSSYEYGTQLWIDPSEEFLQYTHTGDPVDITFSLKELKAFISFCEECEANIHLFFLKAGEPILMAPKFLSSSSFDATLVLATRLVTQLQEVENSTDGHDAEQVVLEHSSAVESTKAEALIGGKKNRKNQQKQVKEQAEVMKKTEAQLASLVIREETFQEIFGIETIRKDWSSGDGQLIGLVMYQGDKEICWAICFARMLQALYNMKHPTDQVTFSVDDLVGQIKCRKIGQLALSNLKLAFKHIRDVGMLKMSTRGHGTVGKRVQADFDLYQDVDATLIQQRLDMYPIVLRLEILVKFSDNIGEVYYLPQKKAITKNTLLHLILLIGHGVTKEGELYFIGQNSWGAGWGCKGYVRIVIKEKCDIICPRI